MNIGVTGASGHLGSATVRELKARVGAQASIVAISRTPYKIAKLGVEARAGDFDKPETLTEAFRGQMVTATTQRNNELITNESK
jgi:NAD(P)H dehydrogenase (quinone)